MVTDSQKWFWLAVFSVSCLLIYFLKPILTPFAIAALLAYLGDPIADRLEAWKFSRTVSVVIVFSALTLLGLIALLLLLPTLHAQVEWLTQKMPTYLDRVQQEWLPLLEAKLGVQLIPDSASQLKDLVSGNEAAKDAALRILRYVFGSGLALVALVGNLTLIPVVTFYLLRDWDIIVARVHALIPRQNEAVIGQLAKESDAVLGAFLRGQLLVMLALSVVYSVGLGIVGLELALLIGLVAGLVSFVPYLGFVVGIVAAGLAAVLQFGDWTVLLQVLIVFGIGQALEGMVLTPLLVGDKIGLHPVAVIFAVLAGGQLFGFVGVLIALPLAAVIMVVLRHAHQRYVGSSLYNTEELANP